MSKASPKIFRYWAYKSAALLLLFDFDIGDLIRWLGGIYTHAHITLDPIKTVISALHLRQLHSGYLVQDYT